MQNVEAIVINQMLDSPGIAKDYFVPRHEQIIKRNVVALQPFPCAIIGSSQIPVGTDNNLPMIGFQPVHEFDAIASRFG
jgi:hypothetical protein